MTIKNQTTPILVDTERHDPFEHHKLPDADLFLRESDHSYWSDVEWMPGKDERWKGVGRLTGISTVVKPFDWESDGLIDWGVMLERQGKEWRVERKRRATEGTAIHKHALHAMATGRPVPDTSQLAEEERGWARAVSRFWLAHRPKPMLAEQVVVNRQLHVAGRFDLMYHDHGITMLDLKSKPLVPRKKNTPFYPVADQVQVRGYLETAIACGLPAASRACVLYVDAEGDFELVESQAEPGDFELAVGVYRRAAAIRKATNKAQKPPKPPKPPKAQMTFAIDEAA